jgi:hypothetical protein
MEVVYSYTGKLPPYIVEAVYQTRLFHSGKITLLCDDVTSPHLKKIEHLNVTLVNTATLDMTEFNACATRNRQKFCVAPHLGDRQYLFILSFQRFFLLQSYMKQTNLTNVLFLELDVLLYRDPKELLPLFQQRELTLSYVRPSSVCSGFSYVRDSQILDDITSHFIQFIDTSVGNGNDSMCEMNALSDWIQSPENKQRVWMLPGLWEDARYSKDAWGSFHTFQETLFDGAGIAIRVDGPDQSHREQWLRKGKVWWGTEVQYNEYDYEWKSHNGLRVLHLLSPEGKAYPVHCLHVHNKNLAGFLSKPMPQPVSSPLLNGDRFLLMAECVLRTKTRSDYYDVKGWDKSTLHSFEEIPSPWDNPSSIFCNTEDVYRLRDLLPRFKNKFVLLSHNSDTNVTKEYSWLPECPLLVHWFTQNLCDELPRTSFLPIGVANPTWSHGNPEMIDCVRNSRPEKHCLIYTNFRVSTNPAKREICKQTLEEFGVPFFPIVDPFENLKRVATSCFTICPEGNGIDTHRFWESLLMKSIPIVLRSPFTERLHALGYPCVLLNTWNDLPSAHLIYTPEVFTPELEKTISYDWFRMKIEDQVRDAKKVPSWALTLVANGPYLQRAFDTCRDARLNGNWKDSIVLIVPLEIATNELVQQVASQFQIELVGLPSKDLSPILSKWDTVKDHPDYSYAVARPFIYMKFFVMSTFFRRWDFVLYLDAGCTIQGDLNRFKDACTDTTCLYAHSDAHPFYEWKLRGQFLYDGLSEEDTKTFEARYSLEIDYFQSTLMIFHTNIIQDTTVEELFALAEASPISRRMDQGIFNLYFLCQRGLWKQIPFRDSKGFLYDYHAREGHTTDEYCVLKAL